MRPNLTLTLGLRWERFGSISEKNDNLSSVVLGEGANALTDMSLRLGGTLYEVNRTDFGPQIGGTWSPTRFNDRMVLRGGFGIGYNGLDQAISLNGRSNPPFLSAAGNLTGSQIVYGVNSFPADVQRVLRIRVEPGDDRQLRSEHQPAGAGTELRADCGHRVSRRMADDLLVSLFGGS